MDFKNFYQALSQDERIEFATDVGTTVGLLHQLAYTDKEIELGLADVMVAKSRGKLSLASLPLTARAKFQDEARTPPKRKPAKAPAPQSAEQG